MVSGVLERILEAKRDEVEALKAQGPAGRGRSDTPRGFGMALRRCSSEGVAVIAEVKKASPSKGVLRTHFDPVAIAREYEQGGAAAISVLTDRQFFQGALEYLEAVRAVVNLPVLRKDFIIDTVQVEQSAAAGADALLLIAAALSRAQLAELYTATLELGMEPLVEVHTRGELEQVMELNADLIGINNRDLSTFRCDIEVTLELIRGIPPHVTVVSESGIEDRSQTARLRAAGVRAVLVGEALVRTREPKALIRELALCQSVSKSVE